jgi:hypothetical protein
MIVVDKYGSEIYALMVEFGSKCGGKDEKELFQLQRECNRAMADLISRHKRELDFRAGEKIEPVAHHAEVVLTGVGSQGMP